MAKKTNKLNTKQKNILNRYLDNVGKKININNALIYGSYAYGRPNKHSDIDLIIISEDFDKMSFMKRMKFLSLSRKGVAENIALDVVGYSQKEFKTIERESAIMDMAKKRGIKIR